MLPYVFLILFLIAAALNLTASFNGFNKLFTATKPALLLLLCLYIFFAGTPSPDFLIIAAFLACWLGDVLLMPEGKIWFALGGLSFLAGHILLIVILARKIELCKLPLAVMIPAALLYIFLSAAVIARTDEKAPGIMKFPLLLYLLCNGAMNLFALAWFERSPDIRTAAVLIGAILFFVSDCALFLKLFTSGKERFYKTGFFVMQTYIFGVLLIALGLAPPAAI